MKLDTANRILKNKLYQRELEKLRQLESDRIFCGHDTAHFLDVARITMIMCREKGIDVQPDLVYSAALLHDIGRTAEYTSGVPHDIAGSDTAERILSEIGCGSDMKAAVIRLIASHRNTGNDQNSLEGIFYAADKKSRRCFECTAQSQCNWPMEKRNMDIEV